MGACCSCQIVRIQSIQKLSGFPYVEEDEERGIDGDDVVGHGDYGALVRVQGSSKLMSMFSKQGRKGVNQDAMTVWEVNDYIHFCCFISLFQLIHDQLFTLMCFMF